MGGPIVRGTSLAGVIAESRDVKTGTDGDVLHYLRADSPHFTKFGEVYCSTVRGGAVKAWKRHHAMTQRLVVPSGRLIFAIYDTRPDSSTNGGVMEIEMGREAYGLLVLPPLLWYGFKGLGGGESIIVNCPDIAHDPSEVDRLEPHTAQIPYRWR